MDILIAFFVGGFICVSAQILIDLTMLTPARIVVIYVITGAVLTALGCYGKFVEFAGAGATVPIIGFGYSLATGAMEATERSGLIGALSGGITKTATGISAAVVFGFLASLFCKSKGKE